MNEYTAYSVFKALRESKNWVSAKGIAGLANIESTSENLNAIQYDLMAASEVGLISRIEIEGVSFFLDKEHV